MTSNSTTMKTLIIGAFLTFSVACFAQADTDVLAANAQVDAGVVQKNIEALEKLYADDFVFTHGTGHVDNKVSWLKNIQSPDIQFKSRVQDSTSAEMHGDVAIIT